jgi:FKBP-type peptidyl-prolyl cis-trans isomerase
VGTDKRERQRTQRLEKVVAENAAAKRARTRRTAVSVAVGTVAIIAVLFAVTRLTDHGSSGAAETSGTTTTSEPPLLGATLPSTFSDPALAKEVMGRKPPTPTPPPANTPADALKKTTLIKGEGHGAEAGDTVTVYYVGNLSNGKVFDESWSRKEPFPVALGQGQVIQGWDEGLVGAKIGERRHLVIGSDKAYGPNAQSRIPANSPLAFDIDVIDITPKPEK